MNRPGRSLLAALTLGLAACDSGEEVEESLAIMSISALPEALPPEFEVSEAWVSLAALDLVPCSTEEASIGVSDFPIDLRHHPPPQAVYGTGLLEYCGVHVEFGPLSIETEVKDLSALVRGIRSDGELVEIESRAAMELDLRGPRFDASLVTLGFDLAAWLANVDVDGAEPDDSGRILIDAEHNAELLAPFETDLLLAAALYQDPDGDGSVGEGELTPVATPE